MRSRLSGRLALRRGASVVGSIPHTHSDDDDSNLPPLGIVRQKNLRIGEESSLFRNAKAHLIVESFADLQFAMPSWLGQNQRSIADVFDANVVGRSSTAPHGAQVKTFVFDQG